MSLRQITEPLVTHGEGPVWMPALGGIAWLDMLAGDLLIFDGATKKVNRRHLGDVVACVRPRANGGFIAALENTVALYDVRGDQEREIDVFKTPGVRFNEGTCDLSGNLLCGTMAYDQGARQGRLYRISPRGEINSIFTDLTIANGIQLTSTGDGRFVDSPTQRIDRLRSTGDTLHRTPFVQVPNEIGMPDGLCMDREGGTWVAMWGGGHVCRYDRDGRLDLIIEVPASQVTACTFGGPSLSTLYITTSRLGLENAGQAGALFAAEVDFAGYPPLPYSG